MYRLISRYSYWFEANPTRGFDDKTIYVQYNANVRVNTIHTSLVQRVLSYIILHC